MEGADEAGAVKPDIVITYIGDLPYGRWTIKPMDIGSKVYFAEICEQMIAMILGWAEPVEI